MKARERSALVKPYALRALAERIEPSIVARIFDLHRGTVEHWRAEAKSMTPLEGEAA